MHSNRLLSARALARLLMPDATDAHVSHVARAVSSITQWGIELRGRAPRIDRLSLINELADFVSDKSTRDLIVDQLDLVFFTCRWQLTLFVPTADGYRVDTLLRTKATPKD